MKFLFTSLIVLGCACPVYAEAVCGNLVEFKELHEACLDQQALADAAAITANGFSYMVGVPVVEEAKASSDNLITSATPGEKAELVDKPALRVGKASNSGRLPASVNSQEFKEKKLPPQQTNHSLTNMETSQ